ncbi:hypothetical protein GQ457_02G035810 [Hibiscus cannabinus]
MEVYIQVRVADPTFLGYFIDKGVAAAAKVVRKASREEEFAPVKNVNGSNYDTPDSARLLVLRLHTRSVAAAGGFLTHSVPLYATARRGGITTLFLCRRKPRVNMPGGRTFHVSLVENISSIVFVWQIGNGMDELNILHLWKRHVLV